MPTTATRSFVAAMAVFSSCSLLMFGCDQQKSAKPVAPATQAASKSPSAPPGLTEVPFKPARQLIVGTPKDIKIEGPLEPYIDKRPPFYAPPGVVNLAAKRPVTSSDKEPIIGSLDLITDGDREGVEGSWVELGPGLQWVQVDLGKTEQLWDILLWHFHAGPRVYKDVIVQVSDAPNFATGVTTVFNNDHDNSAKMGIGKDKMYIESHVGKLIEIKGQAKGRYVRCYSKGNTSDDQNHYIEVEVYGLPGK